MSLGSVIAELRDSRRWSVGKLAQISGVDKGTISRLENGLLQHPRVQTVDKLAAAFELTPDELLARSSTYVSPAVAPASGSMQSLAAKVADLQSDFEAFLRSVTQEVTMVPHLGSVPGGTPLPPIDAATVRVPIPSKLLAGLIRPAALTVSGDSMAPTLINGAELVLETDPDQQMIDGAIYAVQWDGQTCVKRIFRGDGQLTLVSDNPAYRPIMVREGEVILIGRVHGLLQIGLVR